MTDFPLIQRLRNLANAVEHFPNLLAYATTTTLCTVSSSNYTLCDKAYTDSRVSAGAAAANETTQGLVELATGSEMASSTSLGSTAVRLAIPADRATSTPQSCTLNPCAITTRYGLNKVWQGVLDLTEHFVFSSLFATNASTTNATTTTSWGLGSVSYRPPQAAPSASSTILGVSGTSPYQLSWITPPVTTLAVDNASNGTAATATTTVKTLTIAGGTMGLNDSLSLKTTWGITANSVGASCFHTILVGNGSATTTLMNDFSQQLPSFANFDITNKASLSSQFIHGMKAGTTVTSLDPASGATTTAYNTASNIYIAFQSRTANASQSCGMQTMLVQLIKS